MDAERGESWRPPLRRLCVACSENTCPLTMFPLHYHSPSDNYHPDHNRPTRHHSHPRLGTLIKDLSKEQNTSSRRRRNHCNRLLKKGPKLNDPHDELLELPPTHPLCHQSTPIQRTTFTYPPSTSHYLPPFINSSHLLTPQLPHLLHRLPSQ